MTTTAHADNAGGTHISNGVTAWFAGFDYRGDPDLNLAADLAAWESGDWEPSENDGLTAETIADYTASAERTDSKRLA
jgi:hypothetical protein